MNPAYLYVRVSTDEQKRKGYSLIEQEDRLLKYCEQNKINVQGIFREDYSAKDFNRPEWKDLIKTIKKNKQHPPIDVLFIKWDRFSRSVEYAYQMIGILRGLNVRPMAIDQPIDFEVPESIVMLAVYLSIPEAENNRRGINTSDGMRRARKMGRWPAKAPIGYSNATSEGKKIVIPKHPEDAYVKWSFEEYSKGRSTISTVRRMANLKGLKCSRNNFWKLLHNPFYCGLVSIPATKTEDKDFVEGIHEPLITEKLFDEVQSLLNSRRTRNSYKQKMRPVFILRGFLNCPFCGRRLTASISKGRYSKYRYYHCILNRCKGRVRADRLENDYEGLLEKIFLRPEVDELFCLVLEDQNKLSLKEGCLADRFETLEKVAEQEISMSKIRRRFIQDKIDFDDFNDLKGECKAMLHLLNEQLVLIDNELANYCDMEKAEMVSRREASILEIYRKQDLAGKRQIIELFMPRSIDPATKALNSLQINEALSLIVLGGKQSIPSQFTGERTNIISHQSNPKQKVFSDRRVSIYQATKILKRNGIEANEEQTKDILDFLYLLVKTSVK